MTPEEAWTCLGFYPPKNIGIILRDLLDPESLGYILLAVQGSSDRQRVLEIMESLRHTPRIQMNAMMLSTKERNAGLEAWRKSGGAGSWP